MAFILLYTISHGQNAEHQADRIVTVRVECDPSTEVELREVMGSWLTAVTGERETLRQNDAAELQGGD